MVSTPGPDRPLPPAASGPHELSLGSTTQQVIASLHPDGTSQVEDLQRLLTSINRQVAAHLVLDPERTQEGALAGRAAALSGTGWRLWVFWAVDVPDCQGLAAALVQVRAAGVASVRPVHLISLRHWEAWMLQMNDRREALVAAARRQDQAACTHLSGAWQAEVADFNAMVRTFYRGGVPLMSQGRSAVALHADHVPCFRLISPSNHVHALDGFAPGVDLVAWIARCQTWEADQDPARSQR